jgi:NTE family protein
VSAPYPVWRAAPAAPTTALVLSGGCLRGFAQIGVLKALVAAGIHCDLVVGASVGAVVGALYAAGLTPAQIEQAAHALVVARLKRWALSRQGLWSGAGLQELLRQLLPRQRIEDFPRRFAAVATDLASGRAAVFDRGDASQCVVASAAMPGFFVPPLVDGRRCADACLVSPLPVQVARALGAQRVIAVNTLFDPGAGRGTGLLSALLQAPRTMAFALATQEAAGADLLIAPTLPPTCDGAPAQRQALIDAGERCALEALATLRTTHNELANGGSNGPWPQWSHRHNAPAAAHGRSPS